MLRVNLNDVAVSVWTSDGYPSQVPRQDAEQIVRLTLVSALGMNAGRLQQPVYVDLGNGHDLVCHVEKRK